MKKILPRSLPALAIGLIALLFVFAGCASSSSPTPPRTAPTMAVAISTDGSAAPTAAQLATIHQLLQPQITGRGFTVAKDAASADYVMRVRFTPDLVNPAGGHLTFLGIDRNQRPAGSGTENSAADATAATLADLRKAISDTEWMNARSR